MGRRSLIHLPYIQAFRDRHGKMRYYFRRHGRRVALPGLPGSEPFLAAYQRALKDFVDAAPAVRKGVKSGSFDALAHLYFSSPHFLSLEQVTQRNYRAIIERFNQSHGHRLVAEMRREHVDKIIGAMADRPGAATTLLKRLRTLTRYAMEIGWISKDPTAGAKGFRSNEFHTWTEDEIAQFEERWPTGSKQRLAYALLLYTGQRGSDVHRMTWSDIAGLTIRVSQQKTGEKLIIPIHPELQTELALAPKNAAAIIATEYGKPFTVKGFQNFMADSIRAAGLPERCKAHGLRKAAARRLAEAGCTAKQIAAITGHRTLAEVERYTRAADQERLAMQAIEKQTRTSAVKPTFKKVSNLRENK